MTDWESQGCSECRQAALSVNSDSTRTVDPWRFRSKSVNTPFTGWQARERAQGAIVRGEVKFELI
jgi:dihydroorotase-like cyclic amidohydrolase